MLMPNEDRLNKQLEYAYYAKQDAPQQIETPTECNYDEPLEEGRCYWQVQHGWNDPVYIADDVDDINAYMEATYEDGGGYDNHHDAVIGLVEEEGNSLAYVVYANGEVTEYGIPNRN